MLYARISNDLLFYQSVMNYDPLACNTYTSRTYMYIVIRTHVCTNLHLFYLLGRLEYRRVVIFIERHLVYFGFVCIYI